MRIKNAFGKSYEIEALLKEKIQEIVENLDWEKIIKETYNHHCDGYGRTEAQLDITTGKIGYAVYSQGSGDIETHYITLYTIPQNTTDGWRIEDLLDEEEIEKVVKIEEEEDILRREAMEKLGIDFDERFGEYLVYCWLWGEDPEIDEGKENIYRQIEELYEEE